MSKSSNAYGAGIMAKTGKEFSDEYFAEENQVFHESNEVVLVYFTRSRIELFQKAESVTLATHQEQTYVLYGCCSGNLQ